MRTGLFRKRDRVHVAGWQYAKPESVPCSREPSEHSHTCEFVWSLLALALQWLGIHEGRKGTRGAAKVCRPTLWNPGYGPAGLPARAGRPIGPYGGWQVGPRGWETGI